MESATFYFLLVILVILGVIAIKGFRSILLLKMGLRNITRRKVNTFIVVMGLMIGTSIISGSLVVGDTLQNMFTKGVYDTYDETDEEIYTFDQSGSFAFVDDRAYYDIQNFTQQDPVLSSKVEGLSPEIRVPVAVFNLDTRLTETEVTLNGFDYGESQAFGGFQPILKNLMEEN